MKERMDSIAQQSREFFSSLEDFARDTFEDLRSLFQNDNNTQQAPFPTTKAEFREWAQKSIDASKNQFGEHKSKMTDSFRSLLLSLGVSESLFYEIFVVNRNQTFESLLGETIAVLALVFAWNREDEEEFSQTLGEVGAAGLFSLSPITGIITLVGIAIGYQKLFHPEAFKKGLLVGMTGLTVSSIVPGGWIVSLVAALVAVIVVNRKIGVDRPVEEQLKEYWEKLKNRRNSAEPEL